MKLPAIFDGKARTERTRLKLIAKEQARLRRIERVAGYFVDSQYSVSGFWLASRGWSAF
jgi:hypothetical protein